MASYSGKGAPSNGSVYVCNLPPGTDDNMLAEYFGTIGLIKKDKRTGRPKIWLYRDKVTNEPKGDATVTYEDPYAALAAVEWFNNKDFHGATIGVFIAESKKDDNSYNSGIPVEEPSLIGDLGGLEDTVNDRNGAAGRGRGRGEIPSGKAWQQDGDWMCPNTSARPAGASGGGGGAGGRGRGRGTESGGPGRAVGGPTGLFGPNDWSCPMCGNINWAKRNKCNICNTNKPGVSEGGVRGGRAGGYKELDEEEIEETRRRRREADEDDGEMYDEFGNLKKKFRAKMQQAEDGQLIPGAGRAGWEVEELGMSDRERSRDRGRERERDDRGSSRDRGRERDDRGSSKIREREDRVRRRSRSGERDRGRDRDYDYDRDKYDRERKQDSQIDVTGSRKAVIIHVPFRLRKAFRKIHVKLVRELEKKFSGKDVIFVATRRILRPPKKGSAAQRPRSRTLTSVQDAILEDVVVPAEIVGKHVRYRLDGSKIMKIFLDPKERNNTEYKLETFAAVYRKLSGKDVVFEYPMTEA